MALRGAGTGPPPPSCSACGCACWWERVDLLPLFPSALFPEAKDFWPRLSALCWHPKHRTGDECLLSSYHVLGTATHALRSFTPQNG